MEKFLRLTLITIFYITNNREIGDPGSEIIIRRSYTSDNTFNDLDTSFSLLGN